MDVSEKIVPEVKARLANLTVECQVLEKLLTERKAILQEVVKQTLASLVANPNQYGLLMNPTNNVWELKLRPDALAIPGAAMPLNRADRRALTKN